jgi:hypothetical protein
MTMTTMIVLIGTVLRRQSAVDFLSSFTYHTIARLNLTPPPERRLEVWVDDEYVGYRQASLLISANAQSVITQDLD